MRGTAEGANSAQWVPVGQQSDFSTSMSSFSDAFSAAGSDLVASYDLLRSAGIDAVWEPFDPRDQHPTREVMNRTFTLLVRPNDVRAGREVMASLDGDEQDLSKLAEEQYLSAWVGPRDAGTGSRDGFDDDSPRDEHGDYLFESDRRAAEERKAAGVADVDEAPEGSFPMFVAAMVIVFVLIGLLFVATGSFNGP